MSKSSRKQHKQSRSGDETRVEFIVFLGILSAFLPWMVVSLAGLLDPLIRGGAFVAVSGIFIMFLFFHALCSLFWAFGLQFSLQQFKLLGKIVLVIDGGLSALFVCYCYVIFVVIGGLIADRSFPAVWMVVGSNVLLLLVLSALRKRIGKRVMKWFRIDEPQRSSSDPPE